MIVQQYPAPPNVLLLRVLGSLLDGIWGVLECSWGLLDVEHGTAILVILEASHGGSTPEFKATQLSPAIDPRSPKQRTEVGVNELN